MDRQRALIIFGIAWLSAAALSWFVYAKTKMPVEEAKKAVVATARDLPVGTLLRKADLKMVQLRVAEVPRGALFNTKEAENHVLLYPVTANETLSLTKVSTTTAVEGFSSTIEKGFRAVSVQVNDASGVGGLIQPGSRVDVLYTRPGSMAEAITSTILQNVKVLAIGKNLSVVNTPPADSKEAASTAVKAPVPSSRMPIATLVVSPEDAQKLELAKNQGKISLTLRNPLDTVETAATSPVTTEVLDPMISARIVRARRGRTTNMAGRVNLEDPRVWQELTGEKKPDDESKAAAKAEKAEKDAKARAAEEAKLRKIEADKPKFVVDVYRGDKHIQEMFR